MYTHRITGLCPKSAFRVFFSAGICVGGVFGIILGLLEKDVLGLFGGIFFGFIFGLSSGIMALFYTAIFNVLAPYIGGIGIRLELLPAPDENRSAQPAAAAAAPSSLDQPPPA